MELGIALDLSGGTAEPQALARLAQRAEAGGLELVVLGALPGAAGETGKTGNAGEAGETEEAGGIERAGGVGDAGLDPWTTAVWLAGRTTRVQIGVASLPAPDPQGVHGPYPAVVAKAYQSLDLLAGTRLITSASAWTTAPPGADAAEIRALAAAGRPVVVPVRTGEDVDRLAALAADLAGAPAPGPGAPAPEPDTSASGPGTSAQAVGRPGPGTPAPRRSLAVRARRRDGIDYDGVPPSLAGTAIEPGDPGYRAARSTYLRGGAPGLVLRPRTPEQVADALAFARRHRHLPLGVRSGGHGISGRSTNDGGIVIDVGGMNAIEVLDPDRRLVRIGPGATWKQVAAALDPYGWALGSGDYGGVGVGGLATAGGIGFLSRRYGLTIDHLRAVELVLADGRHVRASRTEHPDLFWAVRGAGANFGVATAFEFTADEVREVGWAQLLLVSTDLEWTLRRYGHLASTAPRDTTAFLVTGPPRQGHSVVQLYAMVASPDPEVIVDRLTPFTGLGLLARHEAVRTRYADVMALAPDVGPDGHHGAGEPVSRSAFLPALTDAFARDAAELLRGGRVYFFQLRAMGGAIADTPAAETAFAHRSPAFQVTAMGVDQAALDAAWDRLGRHFDGLYLSFDTDPRPDRVRDAFPPPTLARLRELKRRYDPDNLFRDNFNIDPDAEPAAAGPATKEAAR